MAHIGFECVEFLRQAVDQHRVNKHQDISRWVAGKCRDDPAGKGGWGFIDGCRWYERIIQAGNRAAGKEKRQKSKN